MNGCINYYAIVTYDIVGEKEHFCNLSQSDYQNYTDVLHQCKEKCQKNCQEQVIEVCYHAFELWDNNWHNSHNCEN